MRMSGGWEKEWRGTQGREAREQGGSSQSRQRGHARGDQERRDRSSVRLSLQLWQHRVQGKECVHLMLTFACTRGHQCLSASSRAFLMYFLSDLV